MMQNNPKALQKIKLQKSRSRIRNGLKKNIKTTFSKEGLEIDPDRRVFIQRQFEDNIAALE